MGAAHGVRIALEAPSQAAQLNTLERLREVLARAGPSLVRAPGRRLPPPPRRRRPPRRRGPRSRRTSPTSSTATCRRPASSPARPSTGCRPVAASCPFREFFALIARLGVRGLLLLRGAESRGVGSRSPDGRPRGARGHARRPAVAAGQPDVPSVPDARSWGLTPEPVTRGGRMTGEDARAERHDRGPGGPHLGALAAPRAGGRGRRVRRALPVRSPHRALRRLDAAFARDLGVAARTWRRPPGASASARSSRPLTFYQPAHPRQARGRHRPAGGRPLRPRDRRGLERDGAPDVRHPLPAASRAHGPVRGRRPRDPRALAGHAGHARAAVHAARRRAELSPAGRRAADRRRPRRAADDARRRRARRRVERDARDLRRVSKEARGPRRPLPRGRPGPGRRSGCR